MAAGYPREDCNFHPYRLKNVLSKIAGERAAIEKQLKRTALTPEQAAAAALHSIFGLVGGSPSSSSGCVAGQPSSSNPPAVAPAAPKAASSTSSSKAKVPAVAPVGGACCCSEGERSS